MSNDWIFEVEDYRKVLKKKLEADGSVRGYRTKLAAAAGCQPAYLNHVLDSGAEFTPDHAAGISEFWGLDDLASEYFLNLVHLARAATPRLGNQLQKKLEQLRATHYKTRRSRLSHEGYDSEK